MREVIENCQLFKELKPQYIDFIISLCTKKHYPKGSFIIKEEEKANYLYIVADGVVNLCFKCGPNPDNPPLEFGKATAGDIIGWSSIAEPSYYYAASAVAETEVEALQISGAKLIQLLDENDEFGFIVRTRLSAIISERLILIKNKLVTIICEYEDKAT